MKYLDSVIKGMERNTVVFWGAGRRMHGFLKDFCVDRKIMRLPDFICDSTRKIHEAEMYGIPVLEFETLKKMNPSETIIIITAGLFDLQAQIISNELYYFPIVHCRAFETYYYLKENQGEYESVLGMLADDRSRLIYDKVFRNYGEGCFWCQSIFENNAYFGNDVIGKLSDGDCFAFAGAFNGKHIDRALANNAQVRIHAFEPNLKWYEYLRIKFSDRSNVKIYNAILWDKRDRLRFDGDVLNSGLDAHVITSGEGPHDEVVDSIELDTLIDEGVSLIALDVEGSECRALKGAEKMIRKSSPNLAVCLYHNISDFVKIPQLIESLSGGSTGGRYEYYVKQHSCISAIETVLYAVRKSG